MGDAGGQDVPVVPKCCGSHSGPQVFFGLFQVVSIHPPSHLQILAEIKLSTFVFSILQGVAKSRLIETARGQ